MDNNRLLNNEVNPPQNQEERVENIDGRVLYTNEELKTRNKRVSDDLKDSELYFWRGSKEFANAKNKYDRVQGLWAEYQKLENPTAEDVERLRAEVINAMHQVDKYLDKKAEEKDESKNAKKRTESMGSAFGQLEEQLAVLNQKQEEIENSPAPGIDKLASSAKRVAKEMKDSTLFLRGSQEYDDAMEAFEKANKRFDDLMQKYAGREEEIPPTEFVDCREEFAEARKTVGKYLAKKKGEVVSENTHKRVNAMTAGSSLLSEGIRKMDQLEEAFDKAPAKSMDKVSSQTKAALSAVEEADVGVRLGSDEYKEAKEATSEISRKLEGLAEKGADYKPSHQEIEEMREKSDDALEKIDAYLAMKKGKELSATTQKRVDAMKKAKNAILESRRKFRELNKENMEKADKLSEDELSLKEDTIVVNLKEYRKHVDGQRVWFGSQEFKDGMEAFDEITKKEAARGRSTKNPTEKESKEQIKELDDALKKMAKYIDKKEKQIKDSGKPLDRKGQVRLAEMKAAYEQVAIRKARAESKLENNSKKSKEIQQKKADNRVKEFDKQVRGKKGIELNDAILVAEAAHTLQKYGKKKNLTPEQKEGVRRAVATLFLHEKLTGPDGAKLKESMPRTLKGYGKKVVEIAKSKEFKDLFPDKNITPESARKMLADPKEVKRSLNAFNEGLKKSAEKEQIKEKHSGKEIEMQNLNPNPAGPGK